LYFDYKKEKDRQETVFFLSSFRQISHFFLFARFFDMCMASANPIEGLYCQTLSTFCSATVNRFSATGRAHPLPKALRSFLFEIAFLCRCF
jgi:hypothetical protein